MTTARRVGVGQLVNQAICGRRRGSHRVHFIEPLALVLDELPGNDVDPLTALRSLCGRGFPRRRRQYRCRLSFGARLFAAFRRSCRRPARRPRNLEPAARFFSPRRLSKASGEGRWSEVATLVCHQTSGAQIQPPRSWAVYSFPASSSARLSSETFTRGSPSKPKSSTLQCVRSTS